MPRLRISAIIPFLSIYLKEKDASIKTLFEKILNGSKLSTEEKWGIYKNFFPLLSYFALFLLKKMELNINIEDIEEINAIKKQIEIYESIDNEIKEKKEKLEKDKKGKDIEKFTLLLKRCLLAFSKKFHAKYPYIRDLAIVLNRFLKKVPEEKVLSLWEDFLNQNDYHLLKNQFPAFAFLNFLKNKIDDEGQNKTDKIKEEEGGKSV